MSWKLRKQTMHHLKCYTIWKNRNYQWKATRLSAMRLLWNNR